MEEHKIYEEDIEQAVMDCEVGLGHTAGRMLPSGDKVIHNIRIMTKEHGVLWYGDFDVVEDMRGLKEAFRIINAHPINSPYTTAYPLYIMLDDEWNLNKAFLTT